MTSRRSSPPAVGGVFAMLMSSAMGDPAGPVVRVPGGHGTSAGVAARQDSYAALDRPHRQTVRRARQW